MADPQINAVPSTPVTGSPGTAANRSPQLTDEAFANLLTQQLAASAGTAPGVPGLTGATTAHSSDTAVTPLAAEAWVTLLLQSLPVPGLSDSGQDSSSLADTSVPGMGASSLGSNSTNSLLQLLAQMSSLSATGSQAVAPADGVTSPLSAAQWTVPTSIDAAIQSASAKYGVPASLIRGVIEQESSGNPSAVSSAGALGLMQLMPETANALGVQNPLDATQNIDGGTRYLATLMQQFNGSVPLALAAYNAGPNAVVTHGGIPPYPETQNYVRSVLVKAQNFSAAV